MQTGLNIGTVVDGDSLSDLTEALVKLMEAKADQKTIRHAIDALGRMAKVEHCTISNCVISGDRSVEVKIDSDKAEASVTYPDSFGTGVNVK